ncbi:MAG: UvrD-helicase domain-containing protein, partial [Bryobacteraceae bacterium]
MQRSGQDVCVVAGPGSGKTRVLVERFRRRVEEGVPPARLLAVTFTDKAANELKERLAKDSKDGASLRGEIERAPVHTIHAFCAWLLREHAIAAAIDPRFNVLDPAVADAARKESAEEALDSLLDENPDGMRALLAALDSSDPVSGLAEVYQAVRMTAVGFKQTEPQLPLGALESLREQLQCIVEGDAAGWKPNQQAALAEVKDWARRALALSAGPVTPGHFQVLSEFDCDLRRLRRGNLIYKAVQWVKEELLDAARSELAAEYFKPQRALLWHAVERVHRTYGARKEARNALDFDDLEELAIKLLRDNAAVRERVRSGFDEIL